MYRLGFALPLVVISGCVAMVSPAGYYWGNYSNSFYAYVKAPSEETLAAHVSELERIVEESESRELKVPPGVFAELGYFKGMMELDDSVASYYEKERTIYPEASMFLQRLIIMGE